MITQCFLHRQRYTECVQARGEGFKVWWDKKKAKAAECDFDKITKEEVQMSGLIHRVSDALLQKQLLMERDPTLIKLVQIADQWESSDSIQTALGGETSEYVRLG